MDFSSQNLSILQQQNEIFFLIKVIF